MFFLPTLKNNGYLDKIHMTVCIAGFRKIVMADDYENQGWSIFAPNLTIYGFDADEESCNEMNENIASRQINWKEKHFPIGLGNKVGNTKLYLTKFPGCSSLYPPNEEHMKRFRGYIELIKLSKEIEVKITTLDDFCQLEGIEEIDFIQLDVQGGELDILKGSTSILNTVLGIVTEVEFTDIYVNQPLFGDVDTFMRKNGFSFMDLEITTGRAMREASPIISNQRRGSLIWADAIYFRDLIHANFDSTTIKQPDKIFKLACLADIMNFSDYALEILEYLTLNYGIHDPQYNFADVIIENLSELPFLVATGIENLPVVQRIREYASEEKINSLKFLNNSVNQSNVLPPEQELDSYLKKLCKFLKSRREVEICTEYLRRNGYVSHNLFCKDWDLAHIIHDLSDGNILDMGSSDSYILKNTVLKNIQGEKYGIDLRPPDVVVQAVKYVIGDLMNTNLPDSYFQNITCLSVIEHEVDIKKFVAEVARILKDSGKLYLTFDYWMPKIQTNMKLYGLEWNPLDQYATQMLIKEFEAKNLYLVDDIDWSLGEAVIREGYFSPEVGTRYTFGMLVFKKNILEGNQKKKDYEEFLLTKLQKKNFIICPNWLLSENLLIDELEKVISILITCTSQNSLTTTLFIEVNDIFEDNANLMITAATMNVMTSKDLDDSNLPEIVSVDLMTLGDNINSFASNLDARIIFQHENQEIISYLDSISFKAIDIHNVNNEY